MTMVIGLTGGIASGKSTVAKIFKEKGITVIDADVEARLAVEKGEKAYEEIVAYFGTEILQADGSIHRPKLGEIIFNDKEKRELLNQMVHPRVRERMNEKKEKAIANGEEIIVLDIPLLFETRNVKEFDKTVVVYVDERTQKKRLMARNNLTEEAARARIRSQMPLVEKKQLADEVIDNNGTIAETEAQLISLLEKWGFDCKKEKIMDHI